MFRAKRACYMTSNPNRKSHFTYLLLVILITIAIIAIIIMHTNKQVGLTQRQRASFAIAERFFHLVAVTSCSFVSGQNAIMNHIPFSSCCRCLFALYYIYLFFLWSMAVDGATHETNSNDEKCHTLELYAV